MTTTNLALPEISESQPGKYLTHNAALAILDAAAGLLVHEMASDADYTLSTATTPQEWQYGAIKITDSPSTLTGAKNIIVPTNKKHYTFINATAQALTLKTSAGTGPSVAAGKTAILLCDGTNVVRVTADV
jgi:hypothetical protein